MSDILLDAMIPVTVRSIRKQFGTTVAVDNISLDIDPGDLFFLIGPSGCGKTTLLRMIAGFTTPTGGSIKFADRDVTHVPPNQRHCAMVFQSYALWPHMTVAQNVAFGLDVRRVPATEKRTRVEAALQRAQIGPLTDRKPNQLSGGQQQRVALARALVVEPSVLLLDEPLSNLDAKLRLEMRSQIRDICKKAGITAIYVTHDQKEALSMADRVAVLSEGSVMQVGEPRTLYAHPHSRFVADFLGQTNFVAAEVVARDGDAVLLRCPAGMLRSDAFPDDVPKTGNVTCSIRPEAVRLNRPSDDPASDSVNSFQARIVNQTYLGEIAQYQLMVGDALSIIALELNPRPMNTSDALVQLSVDPHDVVILQD